MPMYHYDVCNTDADTDTTSPWRIKLWHTDTRLILMLCFSHQPREALSYRYYQNKNKEITQQM